MYLGKSIQGKKMYYINEHLKGKTEVYYPDDFPLLKNGSDFAAWKSADGWHIQTTLNGEKLFAKMKELK